MKRSRYHARMLTYLGMLITMAGFLVWWFQNSGFDQLPGQISRLLIGFGLVGYLAARAWLFYVKRQLKK